MHQPYSENKESRAEGGGLGGEGGDGPPGPGEPDSRMGASRGSWGRLLHEDGHERGERGAVGHRDRRPGAVRG